jgi:hypothetical protein
LGIRRDTNNLIARIDRRVARAMTSTELRARNADPQSIILATHFGDHDSKILGTPRSFQALNIRMFAVAERLTS